MRREFVLFLTLFAISFCGCAFCKLPGETVRTVGTVFKTTGKVVEVAGSTVAVVAHTTEKVVDVAGKAAQIAATSQVVKVVVK